MQYLSSLVSFRKNPIDCYRKGIGKKVVDAMRRPGQQHSRRNCPLFQNRFLIEPTSPPILFYYQLMIAKTSMTPNRITVVQIDGDFGC